jgi:hypothetical protein
MKNVLKILLNLLVIKRTFGIPPFLILGCHSFNINRLKNLLSDILSAYLNIFFWKKHIIEFRLFG